MSGIAYQPSFTIKGKYGDRYGPSQFAPSVAFRQKPEEASLDATATPAVLSTGAGNQTASETPQVQQEQMGFTTDPLSDNQNFVQGSVGFRTTSNPYQSPTTNIPPFIPVAAPPMPDVSDVEPAPFVPTGSDDNVQGDLSGMRRDTSSMFGYTPTEANPLALVPFVGGLFDSDYGAEGTFDAQGNVFGASGRAYDPLTGKAVASYKDRGTALSTVGDSYSNLRDSGEGMLSSALGSYENSVYNIDRIDRMKGITPASKAGMIDTPSLLRSNTNIDPLIGDEFQEITPEMLGIDTQSTPGIPELTGELGTDTGDVFISGDTYNPYVVTDDGSLVGTSGTLIQTTNPVTNKEVSLLSKQDDDSYSTKGSGQVIQQEIEKTKRGEYHPAYGYTSVGQRIDDSDDSGSGGGK